MDLICMYTYVYIYIYILHALPACPRAPAKRVSSPSPRRGAANGVMLRPISLIIISLIRFQGLDLNKKSPISDQRLCALSSDSHGKLRFRQGLDRKSGNLTKEIGRRPQKQT